MHRIVIAGMLGWFLGVVASIDFVCAQESQTTAAIHWLRLQAKSHSPEILFDGTSMEKFRGYSSEEIGVGWKIEGDSLVVDGPGGDLITKDEYSDFELFFEWKVETGGNSGVMYRVSLGDKAPYLSGPEYQVLDDAVHPDGKSDLTSAASLYALYPPANKKLNPVGQWNSARIRVVGNHVEHFLNGQLVVQAEIGSADWSERKAKSKFASWPKFGANSSGHLCFQDHGDKVYFRNIVVVRIDTSAAPSAQSGSAQPDTGCCCRPCTCRRTILHRNCRPIRRCR